MAKADLFLDEHKSTSLGIRLSSSNYATDERLYSFPLYAISGAMNLEKELVDVLFYHVD